MGDRGVEALRSVSLEIRAGEILGLAGVSGNGQRELAQCLGGLRKPTAGTVAVDGKDITGASIQERLAAGLAYIPEERMRDGAVREFSVEENIFLQEHGSPQFTHGIFLDFGKMAAHAKQLVKQYAVKTPKLDTPIKNLSGGNIQKVIMAREAVAQARRVDRRAANSRGRHRRQRVHSPAAARAASRRHRRSLLISEDLDEVRELSDRIAVMYEGRIMGILDRDEATVEKLGLMMAGVSVTTSRAPKRRRPKQ